MKKCAHCGKELNDNIEICIGCGCYADSEFTLTFNRKSQFFLVNPVIKIDISNGRSTNHIEIKNGEEKSIKLVPGKYSIHFYASIRSADIKLDLKKNTAFQISWNRLTGQLDVVKEI